MKGLQIASFVLIALGILLYILGVMFKIMHWPDLFKGRTSGVIISGIGVILLIYSIFGHKK